MDDEWELRWVRTPKGTYRSASRETPGADRELLREQGTGRLLGPPESRPADGPAPSGNPSRSTPPMTAPGLSPTQQAVADAISTVIAEVVFELVDAYVIPAVKTKVIPAVKDRFIPAAKRRAQAISVHFLGRRPAKPGAAEVEILVEESVVQEPGTGVAEVEEPRFTMSSDEFRHHLRNALAAEEYAAHLKRALAAVDIADAHVPPELQRVIGLAIEGRTDELEESDVQLLLDFVTAPRTGGAPIRRIEGPDVPPGATR
ncbi:hypothetical protein ACDF64_06125 [Agromyces sp. MMS24-JH15]|uniref:hypothetical protein n=1 Tax=Agromyces sp. MMS24-JH15 TaxID=3243765 RepID=UPI003748589A